MKNGLLCFLFALTAFSAAAFGPGEMAGELKDLKWLTGNFSVAPLSGSEAEKTPLRIVTFAMTRSAAAAEAAVLLERFCKEGIPCALITPDREIELKEFIAARPSNPLPMAWDRERKLTAEYIDGSRIFPISFVVGSDGIILWRGETMDLPEIIRNWREGKFSLKTQEKLFPLLRELESYLRGGQESEMRRLTNAIFDVDPGNAAALRMRIFTLENAGRSAEAWELLDSQIQKVPALPRLYFTALDMASRNRDLREKFRGVLPAFSRHVADPAAKEMMAWNMLNAFPQDGEMLRSAAELTANYDETSRTDGEAGFHRMIRALIAYRLGRVDQAVKYQKQAVALMRRAGANVGDAMIQLEYYEQVLKLRETIK